MLKKRLPPGPEVEKASLSRGWNLKAHKKHSFTPPSYFLLRYSAVDRQKLCNPTSCHDEFILHPWTLNPA
jgi:hypothetical protein